MEYIRICSPDQVIKVLEFIGFEPDPSLADRFKLIYQGFYKHQSHDDPRSFVDTIVAIYSALKYPETNVDALELDKEHDKMIEESGIVKLLSSGVNLDLLDKFKTLK